MHKNWRYILLVLFVFFTIMAFFPYIPKEQISHFNSWAIGEKDGLIKTLIAVAGEYKTKGEGFIVGERITICAAIIINDDDYQALKKIYENTNVPRITVVENSENPEDSRKDICDNFEQRDFDGCYVNNGMLDIIKFIDRTKTVMIKGDVIFTKEGKLSFATAKSDPIGFLLNKYGIKDTGMDIAPRHVKYQVDANKRMESLSWIAVAVAFLSLFITFKQESLGKHKNNRK